MARTRTVKRNGARPTIGVLLGRISGERGTTSFLLGAADAAEEVDANVITFAGESLRSPLGFEAQGNVLYDLVAAGVVDGLVVDGGWLGHHVGPAALQDFCARYGDLPLVSVEVPLEGIPSVLTGFYQGMHDVITHLIEVHGYRRIAFIRGPEESLSAEERYRAYRDALAEHGIPLDMELVAPGTFFVPSGEEAVRLLLDERQVAFEAVAAANDLMAMDAMQALQARGIRVPDDVAVTGFDDEPVTGVVTPPLTTARLGNRERAHQAAEMLLARLRGEKVPEQVVLPTEMVVRQSCGCPSLAVVEAAAEPARATGEPIEVALAAHREQILTDMVQRVGSTAAQAGRWAEQLLDGLSAELVGGSIGAFLSALAEVLSQVAAAGGDPSTGSGQSVAAWQGALSVLRRHVVPSLGSQEALAQAENLWQQARVMIGEAAERIQAYQSLQSEQWTKVLREASQVLITTHDVGELMDTLVAQLPHLDMTGCYLSLYEDPGSPAEWSRLVLAYREGERVVLEEEGRRFASPQLVPEGLLPEDGRYQLIVEPLYFREDQIGFALFEFERGVGQAGLISEALRGQLSSALQGALLSQQVRRRALQLQTAAEVSQAASSILDPDELIQQVVNLVQERFALYYAGLFLVDQTGEWAVLRAGTGEAGQQMLKQEHKLELGGESMIGWCTANKRARIALDVGEEAVRFENPFLPETRSELALPLISRGEAIGALSIQSVQEAAFSDEDIAVLQTLADQLANAIQNARLFDEQQSASALLGERVSELNLLNEIGRRIDESPQVPDLLRWVAERLPSAMQFSDECMVAIELGNRIYGTSEAINLPCQMVGGLRIGDERIGRVIVAYTEKHEFRDEESALMGEIVRRLSGYIESRRLFEQTQEALRMVEATHRRYLEQSWVEYLQSARVTAYETELPGREPLGDALLPEVQQAVEQQEVMAWAGNGDEAEAHSAMVAPIVLRGMVIGALGIHDDGVRQWTEEEIALIEDIAERVALAAENMRLLDETQRRAAREQLVGEVAARVRETLDMETVLRTAVQEIRQTLGLPEVAIRLGTQQEETGDGTG